MYGSNQTEHFRSNDQGIVNYTQKNDKLYFKS